MEIPNKQVISSHNLLLNYYLLLEQKKNSPLSLFYSTRQVFPLTYDSFDIFVALEI